MSHNNYGSGYATTYGSGYSGGGSSYGEGWNGGRRSRSGGRAGPSVWPPRQSPPGMGSAKTHRRQAQRSRSQAGDREDAAKWRQHVAAMPPTPPSPTPTPAPTTRPPTPPSPRPPLNDRLVQFPSPGSTLITITNEAALPDAAPDAPPTPTTSPAAPDPDYVTCDLCGGAGWVRGRAPRLGPG